MLLSAKIVRSNGDLHRRGAYSWRVITREDLLTIELADRDALMYDGKQRQAKDSCLDVLVDSDGGRWTCFRHKGHGGIHVDPSSAMPKIGSLHTPLMHRWIDQ